jgi:hypothetical protein
MVLNSHHLLLRMGPDLLPLLRSTEMTLRSPLRLTWAVEHASVAAILTVSQEQRAQTPLNGKLA